MAHHQRTRSPFVIRIHGTYEDRDEVSKELIESTEVIEEIEGVQIRGVSPLEMRGIKTRVMFFHKSFFREENGRAYRSDVSWLISKLTGMGIRLREVPENGGRYIVWSNDAYYYDPKEPAMGSWAEYALMFKWVKYIVKQTINRQRTGRERRRIDGINDTRDALHAVERLLEET
jgi:hypothetical protein